MDKIEKLFNQYAVEKNGKKLIKGEGLTRFGTDFNEGNKYNPSNALVVFTYYCGPQIAGCINQDEFREGLKKCSNVSSMEHLKGQISILESVWDDLTTWKKIYAFYYKLLFDSEKKQLKRSKSIWVWKQMFTTNKLGQLWVKWFEEKSSLQWVSEFKFKTILVLMTTTKADQSNFDENGLWGDEVYQFYDAHIGKIN